MRMWWFVVCAGLALNVLYAGGQDLRFLNRQTWSTEEGLPQASVHAIVQSRDGYLWLATEGGIARFDGFNFATYTHENSPAFTSDDVSSMAEDASGALWFGTANGLIRKGPDGTRRFAEGDGLPASAILGVAAAERDSVVVLTSRGLARLERGVFHAMETPGHVRQIQGQSDGSVLLFNDTGISRLRNGKVEPKAIPLLVEGTLLGVHQQNQDELWEWSNSQVLRLKQGRRRVWRAGAELQGARVQALWIDPEGTAWVGTNRGLLTLASGESDDFHAVKGFQSQSILTITQDREGNYWIGTEGDGVHALRPRKFASDPASAFDAVTAVVRGSDGAVWFGTRDSGVKRVEGERAATPVKAEMLTSPVVLSMAAGEHGDVWVGTPDGLNHLDGDKVQRWTSAEGLPDDFVRSLASDGSRGVWAGTRRGLAHLTADGSMHVLTVSDGLPSDSIGDLVQVPSRQGMAAGAPATGLWVGTASGVSYVERERVRSFGYRGGKATGAVTALAVDRAGELWVGLHSSGLHLLKGEALWKIPATNLPSEIEAIEADPSGYLWLRARRGVSRVQRSELEACVASGANCTPHVQVFGAVDGLPSDELAAGAGQPSFALSPDGTLWLTTRKGLAFADSAHLPVNTVPPPAAIEQFLVDGLSVTNQDAVGFAHHRYTIDYAGLSYTMPSRTRFRYQLQGYDRDWIEAGTRRSAYYTGLAPGRYRFLVLAQNADGVWSRQPAELSFRVVPPLYRRWWAYCLEVIAAGVIFFAIVQLRLRAEQRRFDIVLKERNRVAREIHDTLAQDLVSVSLHLEIAASMVKAKRLTEAAEQLQETRGLVKQGLASARQSIWSLRANTAQNSLPSRLQASVDRFRSRIGNTHLAIGGAYRELEQDTEDQVVRIAEEALENVRRHALAGEVWVALTYETGGLVLSVKDDGKGFRVEEAQAMSGHYGLRGIQERAASIGGQITITSGPGEGTSVVLQVPLSRLKA